MAWAAFCDAYFAVFCVMVAGLYVSSLLLLVTRRQPLHAVPWVWLLDSSILLAAGLVLGLAFGRGGQLELLGFQVSVRGLYTPVLVLTVLALVRVALLFRARPASASQRSWIWKFAVIGGIACAGPLSPVLDGLGVGIVQGQFVSPPVFWRSSPRGVDLLAYVHPNPNHPVSKWLWGDGRERPRSHSSSTRPRSASSPSASWSPACSGRGTGPEPSWWWLTLGFTALSLGPFVIVAGTNTYVPGPWALLRYVPVINAVRTPTRFSIVAALGLAMLMAGALAALGERWPHRRRAIGWVAMVLLLCELAPLPERCTRRDILLVGRDGRRPAAGAGPQPAVRVRDGRSSAGDFSARYQFEQTRHGKPLIGGYLSRVSQRRLVGMIERFPPLGPLVAMSEGRILSDAEAARFVSEDRPSSRRRTSATSSSTRRASPPSCGLSRCRRSGSRPSLSTGRTRSTAPKTCANLAGCAAARSCCCSPCRARQPSSTRSSGRGCWHCRSGMGWRPRARCSPLSWAASPSAQPRAAASASEWIPGRLYAATPYSKPESRPSRSLCRGSSSLCGRSWRRSTTTAPQGSRSAPRGWSRASSCCPCQRPRWAPPSRWPRGGS